LHATPAGQPQTDAAKPMPDSLASGVSLKKKTILRVDTSELEANDASKHSSSPIKGMMSPTVAYYPGAYNPPSLTENSADRYYLSDCRISCLAGFITNLGL
jgi:hypothetical protein